MINNVKLHDLLLATFSGDELPDFAFRLGIHDYADLSGNTRGAKVISLIRYFSDRGEVEKIVAKAQELRPSFDWWAETRQEESTPATPAAGPGPARETTPAMRAGQPDGAADAAALEVLRAFRALLDQAWRSLDEPKAANDLATAPRREAAEGQPATGLAPAAPLAALEPGRAGALAALRAFRGYLNEAWSVFINQNNYRNRLMRMVRKNHPGEVGNAVGYDEVFYRAYPVLSPEEKALFATVRGLSENDVYAANNRIWQWTKQVSLLALHLADWFKIYEEVFLPDPRHTLVYAGDERGLGHPWPRGIEPAVDAMIAELSKGDMRIIYDRLTDSLKLVLSEAPAAESAEGKPGVLLDYDAGGNLVSLQILEASRRATVPARVSYEAF
jgi:hypothetical protein